MSCPMAHQMGLIQINLNTKTDVQNIKYTIASSGYTFYDYLTNITSSKSYDSSKKPYQSNNTTHYYIATVGFPSSFSATSTIASTADTGNGWPQSESVAAAGAFTKIDVTPTTTYLASASYTPAIGDVFYATSGALSHSYNASYGTPIGMAYNLDTTTKDKALGYKTGYIMALKRCFFAFEGAAIDAVWATGNARTTQITDMLLTEWNISYIKSDRDGLTHCRYAKNNYAAYYTECNVMLKAESFVNTAPLPSTGTSEWYVPSVGQLHDLLLTFSKTCGGNDGLITDATIWTPTFANNYPSNYINEFANAFVGLFDRMNGWFTGKSIPSSFYHSWANGQYYWTSTEIKPDIVYTIDFHPTPTNNETLITWRARSDFKKNYIDRYLRCILAF